MNETYAPMTFEPMPKMPRLNKQVVVTEKLEGTNAQIAIQLVPLEQIIKMPHNEHGPVFEVGEEVIGIKVLENGDHLLMRAGSKNRWLTHHDDNFGFCNWAMEHVEELFELGPGVHRGEWWGKGIQRGYGLEERRFSLFNTYRWHNTNSSWPRMMNGDTPAMDAPKCCHVVPVVGLGDGFQDVEGALAMLKEHGSLAAPGYMNPEGIVVYHTASNLAYKATIENDLGKWMQNVQVAA